MPPRSESLASGVNHAGTGGGGIDDESSLTAALVAALVQTRDGPPPPPSTTTTTMTTTTPQTDGADNGMNSARVASLEGGGDNQDQGGQGQGFEAIGTTTRSGRRTRPTPAALSGGVIQTLNGSSNTETSSTSTTGTNSTLTTTSFGYKKSSRVRWTPQEDDELVKLIKEEPPLTWTQMGERLGRPGAGCAMRWYNFIRQQVGEAEANKLSNIIRGKAGPSSTGSRPEQQEEGEEQQDGAAEEAEAAGGEGGDSQPQATEPEPLARSQQPTIQLDQTPLDSRAQAPNGQMQPSEQMTVGSSRAGASVFPMAPPPGIIDDQAVLPIPPPLPENYYPGGYPSTAPALNLGAMPLGHLPPRLPPDPLKPSYPFPRNPQAHNSLGNSGAHYLPDQALVKDPPIPFVKNTVIRGRRTHDANSLQAVIEQSGGAIGKQKKVHPCPAEHCGAAFKRSEHLKRHYKSVHRGEKPFPCKIEPCGKSFSRKDNLQQHQAMVHGVRAVYTYSDGTVSVNPPDGDEDPVDIAYEEVDITKTARGAARQARQDARAKKAESKKANGSGPSSTKKGRGGKKRATSRDGDSQGAGDEEEDAEGEDDDYDHDQGELPIPPPPPPPRPALRPAMLNTIQPLAFSTPPPLLARPASTVQDLMSMSSAVNQGFSLGPHPPTATARGRGSERSESEGVESNERRGGFEGTTGSKRTRQPSEGGGGGEGSSNGVDKRLRLTGGGDDRSHDYDPALRVLADATAVVSSGRSSSGTNSIASNGISPLIQHALEQRLHHPPPRRENPDFGSMPFTMPLPSSTTSNDPSLSATRPFATSSTPSGPLTRGNVTSEK